MDNAQKSVSPGVAKKIPKDVQFWIWYILEQNNKKQPLEKYLQSFQLDKIVKNGQALQQVTFWAESPPTPITYTFATVKPVTAAVYVLLDEYNHIMVTHKELEDNLQ